MGQVPSEHINSAEPYIVTLESGRSGERLAAVTLSTKTIGSVSSPLFQHFYAARCDDCVRHWYCSDPDRHQINDAPAPEEVYARFVEDATRYAEAQPTSMTPMPLILLKLHDCWAKANPTAEDLMNAVGIDVVGYFGCRHFNRDGTVDNYGVIGMFLTKAFHNESKSVAILEIAAKCYAESCAKAGCRQTVWPSEIHFGTLDTNLPCLRLIQKLLGAAGETFMSVWGEKISCVHDEEEGRFKCVIRGGAIASFAEDLASKVDKNSLKAKSVDRLPQTTIHPVLDATVQYAKAKWLEANRAVHDAHHQRELEKKEKLREAANATPAPSSASSDAPSSVSKRSSSASVNTVSTQPTVTTHVHNPYAQHPKPPRAIDDSASSRASKADLADVSVPASSSPAEEFVYLPKRTPIYFWKKNMWLHVQWRSEERSLRLAPVQQALDQGLLCVEACYDNPSEIAIFDEWHRPARLRLEHPTFYVATNSVYTMDPVTKAYSPLYYETETTIEAQPTTNVYGQAH